VQQNIPHILSNAGAVSVPMVDPESKKSAPDRALQATPDWLESALVSAGDVAYFWDVATDRLTWSGNLPDVLVEVPVETLASGHALNDRIHPEDLPRRLKALSDHFALGKQYDCEYRLRTGHGQVVWVHDRGLAKMGGAGVPKTMAGTLRIITQRKQTEARLERAANYDDLTGHFNKSRLRQELEQAMSFARRFSIAGAFLVVGVDKLALINSAYGYEVGDAVLVTVGQRLDRFMRASDVVGRLSGDRFGIVLTQCPEDAIAAAMDRIIEVMRDRPIDIDGQSIPVTVSIGCVMFPNFTSTAYDVIARAETALNAAKLAGRSCWQVHRPSEQQSLQHRRHMVVAAEVQRAVREDRLVFTYQPIVKADNFEVIKYECLLRLRDEQGKIMSAAEFIPVVEELGMTRFMDRHVLDMAIADLRADPALQLSMNISGLTATDQAWLRALNSAVKATPEVAPRLVVEITETAALHDIEETARFVNAVRDLGCRVAIDDFGAGFTSFRHLKALTVDMVKIDGSFVRDLAVNVDNQLFIRNLMGLAETFGLRTCAEFVENAEDAAFLVKAGVDFLQGYYFGRPDFQRRWRVGERIQPEIKG
jgi:diguanylate cyclase (GGDEF)-like protein